MNNYYLEDNIIKQKKSGQITKEGLVAIFTSYSFVACLPLYYFLCFLLSSNCCQKVPKHGLELKWKVVTKSPMEQSVLHYSIIQENSDKWDLYKRETFITETFRE